MTAKYHNDLRFYTLRVQESPEEAEKMARQFEIKFNKMSKYNQVAFSLIVETEGFEEAFNQIDNYGNDIY